MSAPTVIRNEKQLLAHLVQELADAHEDTVRLATGPAAPIEWEIHIDYLRALQRLARAALADAG